MVALLVRLKLTLLRRSFTRSGAAAFGMVVAYLVALGLTLPAVVGLAFARSGGPDVVEALTVPVFAVITVGWLVFPLLFFGVDETLDPGRFALLPVRAGRLLPGLVAASFVGAPGLALGLLCLGLVIAWSGSPAALLASVVAVPLGAVTCVLVSRALTTALAGALGRRRTQENVTAIVAFVGLFFGVGIQVVGRLVSSWAAATQDPAGGVRDAVTIAGWTPVGWAWAVPGDVAHGRYVVAAIRLVLAVSFCAGLGRWWQWSLDRALASPLTGTGEAERVRFSAFLERLFGTSPRGAVAARIVRSWRRDSRAMVQVATLVVIPVLMVAPSLLAPGSGREEGTTVALLGAGPMSRRSPG